MHERIEGGRWQSLLSPPKIDKAKQVLDGSRESKLLNLREIAIVSGWGCASETKYIYEHF